MWTFLVSILPFLQDIINWWTGVEQAQTNANTAEQTAESQHQSDGVQSVADQTSDNAQNAALDQLAAQEDNPTPIVVSGGK